MLFHPGHVQTDMGGQAAPVMPHTSIEGMKNQIVALTRDDNGRFLSYDGHQIPWWWFISDFEQRSYMTEFKSSLNTSSADFIANSENMQSLIDDLRTHVARELS